MTTVEDWLAEYERLSLQGDNAEALDAVEHALALDPEDPSLWLEKGLALKRLDRFEEALEVA